MEQVRSDALALESRHHSLSIYAPLAYLPVERKTFRRGEISRSVSYDSPFTIHIEQHHPPAGALHGAVGLGFRIMGSQCE